MKRISILTLSAIAAYFLVFLLPVLVIILLHRMIMQAFDTIEQLQRPYECEGIEGTPPPSDDDWWVDWLNDLLTGGET